MRINHKRAPKTFGEMEQQWSVHGDDYRYLIRADLCAHFEEELAGANARISELSAEWERLYAERNKLATAIRVLAGTHLNENQAQLVMNALETITAPA